MRPSWHQYFMAMARLAARRSTCLRDQVGCVIVSLDHQMLATGYNGAPRDEAHCEERGCLRQQLGCLPHQDYHLCRGVHSEQNAIAQSARKGISLDGVRIFITRPPCYTCAKMLVQAGIRGIYLPMEDERGFDDEARRLLERQNISVLRVQEEVL